MRVRRREVPSGEGLADWLETGLMDSRAPRPLVTAVTAVCIRQAGAVLSRNAWGEND